MDSNTSIEQNTQPDNQFSEQKRSLLDFIKERKILFGVIGIILIIIIATVIVLSVFTTKEPDSTNSESLIEEARQAYIQGDLESARSKLEDAYKGSPNDPGIQAAIIKSIASQGNLTGTEEQAYQEAQKYVGEALRDNPNDSEVLLAVGYLEETAGKYEEALSYYQKALEINDTDSNAWFHTGHALYFLGRYEEGQEAYENSYRHNNNNSLTLIMMGNIAVNNGQPDEAFSYFMKASQVPNISSQIKAEALTSASVVRRTQIIYLQEAIDLGKEAVELAPKFSPALAAYGYALSINGNPAEGFEYIKQAIQANPRISRNLYQGALVLRANQMYSDAINYMQQAIEKVNNDNTILGQDTKNEMRALYTYELAKTYSMSGGHSDTIILLQQATLINPLLRETIQSDIEFGFFSEIANTIQFQNLIQ